MADIDPSQVQWDEPNPQPNTPPNLNAAPISPYYGLQQSAQTLFGDEPARGDEIQPSQSPIDFLAGAGASRLGEGAADIVGNEVGAIRFTPTGKMLGTVPEDVLASGSNQAVQGNLAMQAEQSGIQPPLDTQAMADRVKARYGNDISDKKWSQIQKQAESSNAPYTPIKLKGKVAGIYPNYNATPTGVIGNPEDFINPDPKLGTTNDPFQWADNKYQASKALLQKHQAQNIPTTITTGSDLIAHDDYINSLPQNSKVDLVINSREPVKGLEAQNWGDQFQQLTPSHPSQKRMVQAYQKLKDSGVNTQLVYPDTVNQKLQPVDPFTVKKLLSRHTPEEDAQGGLVGRYDQGGNVAAPIDPSQVTWDNSQAPSAQAGGIDPNQVQWDSDTYTTPGQQALAGGEGLFRGVVSRPVANTLEVLSGLTTGPAIEAREANNPWTAGGFETAGLIGSGALGFGLGGVLNEIGHAAPIIGGALSEAGSLGKVASYAAQGAAELGAYSAQDQLGHAITDPNLSLGTAVSRVGLSTVIGGTLGAGIGAISPLWKGALKDAAPAAMPQVSELDAPGLAAGDLKTSIPYTDIPEADQAQMLEAVDPSGSKWFKGLKPNSDEIAQAANDIGAPIHEGMISSDKWIQKATDSLLDGGPTFPAIQTQKIYQRVADAVSQATDTALGAGTNLSQAEVGQAIQKSLTDKIAEQVKPINDLYAELKQYNEAIPLSEKSAPAISRAISQIQEVAVRPDSPASQLALGISRNLKNLKSVDDIKVLQQSLGDSLKGNASVSAGEKFMAGILDKKLDDLATNSITRYAENVMKTPKASQRILDLLDAQKAADAAYAPFRENLQTLGEKLGNKNVQGAANSIRFINEDITPENLVDKLYSPKDSQFQKFFNENFPEESQFMNQYKKGVIRDTSMSGENFDPKKALKQIFDPKNGMSPELRNNLFSPQELQKLDSARIVSNSIPQSFNPSHSSGGIAFRNLFEKPLGAVAGNLRDYAMQKLIKYGVGPSELRTAESIGKGFPPETVNESKGVIDYFRNIYQGNQLLQNASKAFFVGGSILPAALIPDQSSRDDLKKSLKAMDDPEFAQNLGSNIGKILPEHATGVGTLAATAQNYFKTLEPTQAQSGALNQPMPKSALKEQIYERQLGIAQQPLMALQYAKKGTLQAQDVTTLQTLYPKYHAQLIQQLTNEMIQAKAAGKQIPYAQRQSLSLLMGTPLDSTLTQPVMQSVMAANAPRGMAQPQGNVPRGTKPKATTVAQQKVNSMYSTPNELRQAEAAKP